MVVIFVIALTDSHAVAPRKRKRRAKRAKDAGGSGDDPVGLGAMKQVLTCTACERVITRLAGELSRLLYKNAKWNKDLRATIRHKLRGSCMHPEDFPKGNELYQKGCAYFMADYHKAVLKALKKRLDPKAEEYEEDIVSSEFCAEISACPDGMQSMDSSFAEAQRKRDFQLRSNGEL